MITSIKRKTEKRVMLWNIQQSESRRCKEIDVKVKKTKVDRHGGNA